MTSNKPSSTNPPFRTPEPTELQSPESRAAIEQQLTQEQGGETDVVNDRPSEERSNSNLAEAPFQLEDNMDELADRHMPQIDSPPG